MIVSVISQEVDSHLFFFFGGMNESDAVVRFDSSAQSCSAHDMKGAILVSAHCIDKNKVRWVSSALIVAEFRSFCTPPPPTPRALPSSQALTNVLRMHFQPDHRPPPPPFLPHPHSSPSLMLLPLSHLSPPLFLPAHSSLASLFIFSSSSSLVICTPSPLCLRTQHFSRLWV